MKKRVLFICTHNSARSQMAEAFLKELFPDRFEAFSAGTEPGVLNPYVIKAMKEIGIDISHNTTKSVKEFIKQKFDYIITVCDRAKETCPFFPGGLNYIHQNFEDPSTFKGSNEEIMVKVRKVRDEIKVWVGETFKQI
jgi:arsenate reductase